MNMAPLLFFIFFTIPIQSSPIPPSSSHFIKSIPKPSINQSLHADPQQYFEITRPVLPSGDLSPACSVPVLNHSFGDTYGLPPVTVEYVPPPATCLWSLAVLEFRAACKGEQYDRIAGVWLAGAELLRTSTAQPTEDGIFWNVQKDVTRYSSLLTQSNLTLAVMLENIVDDEFTGVYDVNVSLLFYSVNAVRFPLPVVWGEPEAQSLNRKLISVKNHEIGNGLGLDHVIKSLNPYDKPADLIIPIAEAPDEGFWFRIENEFDCHGKKVQISPKTYKAVLELYVSFHGDDEFWYMNPPDSYIEANNLTTRRAHGAYREVLVTIDGKLAGTVIPFPVIFTGGINPLFWEPVVSIGAFDLPSYDIDLTPLLGLLLDNKDHWIGLQVAAGISFWLIDANLHLWFDHSDVKAMTVDYQAPAVEMECESKFELLDGEFEVEVERSSEFAGWVTSSAGNLITRLSSKLKFKNTLNFKDNGARKEVKQEIRTKTKIKIRDDKGHTISKVEMQRTYPLTITTETVAGSDQDNSLMTTKVVQGRVEKVYDGERLSSVLNASQNCTGLMLVKGQSVLSGSAENHQSYDSWDQFGCYARKVDVVDGVIVGDGTCSICRG